MKILPRFPKVGKIPNYQPSHAAIWFVLATVAWLFLLYAFYGHWAITTFVTVALVLKGWLIYRKKTLPKFLLLVFLLTALGLLIALFGGYTGRQASLGLLTLLLSLKALESYDTRGYSMTCLLMYFLCAVIFAYEDSSAAIWVLCLSCLLITACLALLSQPDLRHAAIPANHSAISTSNIKQLMTHRAWLSKTLKDNSKLLLQALPLTILLFFLFPRIQGNFGFLPGDNNDVAGLENSLSAGDFSRNAFSNELAFRVEFAGNIPDTKNLYWRSKVFDSETQFTWKKGQLAPAPLKALSDTQNTNIIDYRIIHQATRDHQLPVLKAPQASSIGKLMDDYTLVNTQYSPNAFEYSLTSNLQASHHSERLLNVNHYLQTSFAPGPQTAELLKQWRQQSPDIKAFVATILQHFNQQPFQYTLTPPQLNQRDPVEDFLFTTRSGYCELYASVFTLLMRWSGIPARVVVGYQGGKWIEEGQFLEVRYSDAHAWSEVWIDNQGWQRVDPTFAIAPERIEFGMDALFALWENNQIGSGISALKLADMLRPKGINKTWQKISRLYRSYNHRWDKWIVNFNYQRQMEILKTLKLDGGNSLIKLLGLLFASSLLVISILLYRLLPKKIPLSPTNQYYQEFLAKLAKQQVFIDTAEGPLDFAKRASEHLPNNKADIYRITQYYITAKYDHRDLDLQKLRSAVKRFSPRKPVNQGQ